MSRKRTGTSRFLPKYVSAFESQHGAVRYVFRKKGLPTRYFTARLGTEAFRAEYDAFLNAGVVKAAAPKSRAASGTIDDLLDRYMSVPERLGPSAITQQKITAILGDFRNGDRSRGQRRVETITFEAIDKIVAKKRIKTGTGNKTKGGVHAAIKLRKELVRLFDFAVKSKMIDHNPATLAEKVKLAVAERSDGFHTWTEDEIGQYRDHHRLGTRERLAMELLLWTDQRRSDVVTMGMSQVRNGRIPVTQEKTGKTLWLTMAPQLLEAIIAMPPADTSPFCFLTTRWGRPFKNAASFGTWFKLACTAAGLPHCTSHGLRKASLRRMAELEMANKTMKSVSGQTSDKTLAGYTDKADQAKLADAAIRRLSAWELSLRADDSRGEKRAVAND